MDLYNDKQVNQCTIYHVFSKERPQALRLSLEIIWTNKILCFHLILSSFIEDNAKFIEAVPQN